MIDLSYKPKKKKKTEDEWELHPVIQFLIMVLTALFFAYIFISGFIGEPLF